MAEPLATDSPTAVRSSSGPLAASVLVLNRLYMAIHVVNVRRAFALLCRDLAEVIDIDQGQYCTYNFESWREISELRASLKDPRDDWIRTVNFELQVPRVIRLLSYDRIPRQSVKFNRRNIFARDRNQCQYCGNYFPTSELSLDHVKPRSQGGDTNWTNIVCACVDCNIRKGGRTPDQAQMRLIRKPFKPTRSPLLSVKLTNPKYHSWKSFIDEAYWSVDLK